MRLSDYIGQATGFVPEAPIDGNEYARKNAGWVTVSGAGGGIGEAPADGQVYARNGQQTDWEVTLSASQIAAGYAPLNHNHNSLYALIGHNHAGVYAPAVHSHDGVYQPVGSYLTDAPADGGQYARQNGAWTVVVGAVEEAPQDGNQYARKDGAWEVVTGGGGATEDWLRADIADAKTNGDLTFNQNVAVSLAGNGKLYYNGSNSVLDLSSGDFLVRSGSTTRFTMARSSGNFTATGNVTAYSDARLKRNVRQIHDALARVRDLNGVTFERIDVEDQRQTGLIAQEVQQQMPEAVRVGADGYLTVAYGNLVGLLVEAIKDLADRVEELEHAAAD